MGAILLGESLLFGVITFLLLTAPLWGVIVAFLRSTLLIWRSMPSFLTSQLTFIVISVVSVNIVHGLLLNWIDATYVPLTNHTFPHVIRYMPLIFLIPLSVWMLIRCGYYALAFVITTTLMVSAPLSLVIYGQVAGYYIANFYGFLSLLTLSVIAVRAGTRMESVFISRLAFVVMMVVLVTAYADILIYYLVGNELWVQVFNAHQMEAIKGVNSDRLYDPNLLLTSGRFHTAIAGITLRRSASILANAIQTSYFLAAFAYMLFVRRQLALAVLTSAGVLLTLSKGGMGFLALLIFLHLVRHRRIWFWLVIGVFVLFFSTLLPLIEFIWSGTSAGVHIVGFWTGLQYGWVPHWWGSCGNFTSFPFYMRPAESMWGVVFYSISIWAGLLLLIFLGRFIHAETPPEVRVVFWAWVIAGIYQENVMNLSTNLPVVLAAIILSSRSRQPHASGLSTHPSRQAGT